MPDQASPSTHPDASGNAPQPSGPKGDNPATAGSGPTTVTSPVPEKAPGKLDPSSPGNTGTTPGSDGPK